MATNFDRDGIRTPKHPYGGRRWLQRLLGLCALIHLLAAHSQVLWPEEEQRLHVGQKLFAACLTADEDLGRKVTAEGEILVLVVHAGMPDLAGQVAGELLAVERVAGRRLRVQIIEATQVAGYRGPPVAGLFVATPGAGDGLLADWGERLGALVFSPFAGDVERGAVAGIFVSDRILPLVNLNQARNAGVRFKPFFLRVAKTL